ncbi:lymphocyte-specific protein 1 isoform X2 [Diceros bicornis minor]|uniref:lymphocyte-specific protein 1 isoform X2 n=1 Tax=Diceros bicornis minor TaxID=77932 RepID=UPI0026EDD0A3|nr:lymphocyte-specific protein 1 isoform X2 [Diceros bicornis minor]
MSSSALLRRNSSKQGLENLLRLTTQWSVEDEEEAARERRRRERDRQLRAQDEDGDGQSSERQEQEKLLSLKPTEAPELDEDEGFSDWSQKPEQRQQHLGAGETSDGGESPQGKSPEGEQEEDRSLQHARGHEDSDELSQAGVCLEELHLSPSSEPQEETEPRGPEGTVQGSQVLAEAEEADEQHEKHQQPRTPSPLVLEGSAEQGSPPLSPSTKLSDRTESLNRSIKKSNSVKKSQPALPISKIDERLEQYTQAIETGRTPKLARQPSIELPSMAVASTKSRWETGEVQAQSAAKAPSCKDIVAGDMSKKSLWEQKGGAKTSSTIKSTPSGKRYKFVATGHGKYEKVLVDEGSAP